MEKKTKCYRCDKAPVVWYWYGCDEDYSQLAACGDHERSLEWARIYSFRIEKAKEGTIDLQENRQNMYVSKGIIDKIKDKMIASRAGSTNGTSSLQPKLLGLAAVAEVVALIERSKYETQRRYMNSLENK